MPEASPQLAPVIVSPTADKRLEPPWNIGWLSRQMIRGDESAYRIFYQVYFNRLLRYLLVVTQGREEAAREALQLTLVRVVRHIKKFETEDAFWSWLTVLARSSAVDEERKRRRYLAFLERFFTFEKTRMAAPEHDTDAQLQRLLDGQLAELPADERDLINRKYQLNQSVRTMAEELQCTEKSIESRLLRIRQRIRNSILTQLRHENHT